MKQVAKIENTWKLVDVKVCFGGEIATGCIGWTAQEVQLLYNTLKNYSMAGNLDDPLTFIRTKETDYAGLTNMGTDQSGRKWAKISISDDAWYAPVAKGIIDSMNEFWTTDHFQGTIAHELTHAVTWFHPEKLDRWMEVSDFDKGDWRLGYSYDWSVYDQYKNDPVRYKRIIQGELFAMMVSALAYEPWWGQAKAER